MHERGINALYFVIDIIMFNLNSVPFRDAKRIDFYRTIAATWSARRA
ncbi:hypothetical protein [Bradyrhizobium sp. CB1015]|nr:hypothetical protein [Bradyrhizobium sp. CB1015]UWU94250.1 hypothetical protein N2604_10520 [Bradyrhizobium sp. CB1015]